MIPPAEVAERWGTPTYVYDLADIRQAVVELRRALPQPAAIYFSIKANPHPDVCRPLAEAGLRAEIASLGEIAPVLAAGFAPGAILMTGPGKSATDLDAALTAGIRRFSVDSPADLGRVGAAAARHDVDADCLLRVNADLPVPGMGLSMTGTPSAFGADASWIMARPELFIASGRARVRGLHLYMGTNITDIDVLVNQFETSMATARQVRSALGVDLVELNFGGGFGMPYARSGSRPDLGAIATRLPPLLDAAVPGWSNSAPLISFESGRFLAGGCGTLVCSVLDVKLSKGRTFVVLDSGIHHLGGMSGLRRVPRIVPDLLRPPSAGPDVADCCVVGPLCTPLDVWSQGVSLPPLAPGDVLAVPNVGAYGLTAGLLGFLSHPPATEVVVDGNDVVSVTRLTVNRNPVHAVVDLTPSPAVLPSRSRR